MFTGIVTDIGEIAAVESRGDTHFEIKTAYETAGLALGASVSCAGCCLTVVSKTARSFSVQVSAETLSRTTLGKWNKGMRINLERAVKVGDELGGHIVSGHVDGVGTIVASRDEGDSRRYTIRVPQELSRFIASKGSVTLDGTSLTVNETDRETFGVNIIPHTLAVTTWGALRDGDAVNVEIDMLARYVARLAEFQLK